MTAPQADRSRPTCDQCFQPLAYHPLWTFVGRSGAKIMCHGVTATLTTTSPTPMTMTSVADTFVPRHLTDEERALWEKAQLVIATRCGHEDDAHDDAVDAYDNATAPESILSVLTALATEREAGEKTRAALAEATTPDIMGNDDGDAYYETDYDCLVDEYPVGTIREVCWIARIATAWDEDGSPDEFETRVFESRADAEQAIAAATSTEPTHA